MRDEARRIVEAARPLLSDSGYLLACALADLVHPQTGEAQASNTQLQALTGLSRHCIQYRLRELERANVLRIRHETGKHRHTQTFYYFLPPASPAALADNLRDIRTRQRAIRQEAMRVRKTSAQLHQQARTLLYETIALHDRQVIREAIRTYPQLSPDDALQAYLARALLAEQASNAC